MKKRVLALILPLFLLLSACQLPWQRQEEAVRTMDFYYLAAQSGSYGSSNSALAAEPWVLEEEADTPERILQAYLQGPRQQGTASPFPAGLTAAVLSLDRGLLTVEVSEAWSQLTGTELELARACLVLTMTQLSQVEQVQICLPDGREDGEAMEQADYLLFDDWQTGRQQTVRLYFSDANGRYLLEEDRNSVLEPEALPEYVLQELLKGPERKEALAVLPEGTNLLSVQTEKGICTVDLSEAFCANRPKTHTQARLTVFSVVDSLTELDAITGVRILCEGEPVTDYCGLDLSAAVSRDLLPLERPLASSLDGSLYVPCGSQGLLAEIPIYVRQTGGRSRAETILDQLLVFPSGNGYENPFPDGTAVAEINTEDGLCQVTFNSVFAQCDADSVRAEKAVRAVTETLCSLDEIDSVRITVNDAAMHSVKLSEPLRPDSSWKLP